MNQPYEAYFDDYGSLSVYMSKNFFGGKSSIFHLKDSKVHIIPLQIESKVDLPNGYTYYHLVFNENLEIGEEYILFDEHCQTTPAQYSHIVKTVKFGEDYRYDKDDLGAVYTPEKTVFTLWAPTAHRIQLHLDMDGKKEVHEMQREADGIWRVSVEKDLDRAYYTFMVRVNGAWQETTDPYTIFSAANGKASQVVNPKTLKMPKKVEMPVMENNTDAIIYEASIRDMTSQTGVGVAHPKKFLGFVEENNITKSRNTGFTYLKSLGITHVQLLPVFDFGSVDEMYPNIFYNWGYDPMQYRVLEGGYTTDPNDGAKRVEEFAYMVSKLHEAGIKVNLDLVFNHVYNKGAFALERLVPNYYFLMNSNGEFSNGSFCGNDIDTQPYMSKKYFLDTCKKIVELYDVDGFRFDLMGILDYQLMNEIVAECRKIKPDFMVYGEGWNMPSFVEEGLRATQINQAKMPEVGHFSDRFREIIRGSNNNLEQKGFASGRFDQMNDVMQVMCGSVKDHTFTSPQKVVNYVECHDNHTLWDKNRVACHGEDANIREKRQVLTNAMVLFAQGIPFLHAGQEFGRTKQNIGNSYNRSDNYNRIDYFRRDRHINIVKDTKRLIQIRKEHPAFRMANAQEIRDHVFTETIENQVLVYKVNKGDDRLVVFFNPTNRQFSYDLKCNSKILFDNGLSNPEYAGNIQIAPYSVVVCELQ
jgi:pullulanase